MVHFSAQNNRDCRVKHTRFDLHPIFVTIYMAGCREEYAWGEPTNKTPYCNKDMREKHYLCMEKRTDGLNFPV